MMGIEEALAANNGGLIHLTSEPSLSHHPKDANYFTVDLTVLKKMAQELADLFCLTLPVSWKK